MKKRKDLLNCFHSKKNFRLQQTFFTFKLYSLTHFFFSIASSAFLKFDNNFLRHRIKTKIIFCCSRQNCFVYISLRNELKPIFFNICILFIENKNGFESRSWFQSNQRQRVRIFELHNHKWMFLLIWNTRIEKSSKLQYLTFRKDL